jgi:hypothetical protein
MDPTNLPSAAHEKFLGPRGARRSQTVSRKFGSSRTLLLAALICGALNLPVLADSLVYTVNGTFGAVPVSGTDVLSLAGKSFTITGVLDSTVPPTSTGPNSATYLFNSLTLNVGALNLPLGNIPVTFTVNPGNIPTIDVGVTAGTIVVTAVVGLPPGTFTNPSPPSAFAGVSITPGTDPVLGSVFTYGVNPDATVLSITGAVSSVAEPPKLVANPNALSFGFLMGGPPPPPQTTLITAGTVLPLTVTTDSAPWISVASSSASSPSVLTVTVNPTGLPIGVYSSTISVTSPQAQNSPLLLPVQFVVANPPSPGSGNLYLPLVRSDFSQIAPQGFGDRQNGWAWSMEWFKGKLFVGTNRAFHCVETYAINRVLPLFQPYPPLDPDIDCAADPNDLPLQAEIWSWSPDTNTWTRVFQSPNDIPNPDAPGKFLPPDIGFRGMLVFTEKDGTQALYVSGVCSKAIHPSGIPGARVLRSTDGVNFVPIPQDPGTFLGDADFAGFRGLTEFNGNLYAIAGTLQGAGVIVGSTNPSQGNNAWQQVSPDGLKYYEVGVYNNFLYATQSDQLGFSLVKTDATGAAPYTFKTVIPNDGYRKLFPNVDGLSLKVFKGDLYIGGDGIHSFFGAELFRAHADDSWDLLSGLPRDTPVGFKQPLSGLGPGFGWDFNAHMWRMEVFDGRLYVGTFDLSTTFRNLPYISPIFTPQEGFDLWWSQDGVHFFLLDQTGFGDQFNFGARSIKNTPWGLMLGSANYFYGTRIYQGIPGGFNFPPIVNPADPSFTFLIGSTVPASQVLQITSVNVPTNFTLVGTTTTPPGGNWLQVSASSITPPVGPGSTPVTITANPSGLPIGVYTGVITFTGPSGVQREVTVTLNIVPITSLRAAPSALTFNYIQGGTVPLAQTVSTSSTGGPVNFTAVPTTLTPTNGSWLQVSPASGTALVDGSTLLAVSVSPAGLPLGTYTGQIVVSGATLGPQVVSVTLNVQPPGHALVAVPNPLKLVASGFSPPTQNLAISTNGVPLAFEISAAGTLLSLSKTGGNAPGLPGAVLIGVTVNNLNVPAGTYESVITVTSDGATNSPLKIPVVVQIEPPASQIIGEIENGQGWRTTGLVFSSGGPAQPYKVDFWKYDGSALTLPLESGSPASESFSSVAANGLVTIATDGSGSALAEGWASFQLPAPVGGAAVLTNQPGTQAPSEVAVPSNSPAAKLLFLPFDETASGPQYHTRLALTNPGANPAVAMLTFVDDSGQPIPITGTITVPNNGHFSAGLADMFPALAGKRGVAQISSKAPLAGLGIRSNGTAFTALPAMPAVPAGPKTIPHILNGAGWKSSILLINTDTQPAAFTLSFHQDDGTPLTLPLGPDGNVSSVSGTIAPGMLRIIQSDGSGDVQLEGSAALNTTLAVGGLAIFTAPAVGSQPPFESSEPLIAAPAQLVYLPFDQTNGLGTEVVVANPGSEAAIVTLSFFDETGAGILGYAPITVEANGHATVVLSEAYSQLQGQRGVVQVQSYVNVAALGIRLNGTSFTAISAFAPGSN